MPYITQEYRDRYDEKLDALIADLEEGGWQAGDVTYVVYKIVGQWFRLNRGYQTICEIRGMLAGVLSEFDRRFAFPYEDEKVIENGDIDWTVPDLCGCGRELLGIHTKTEYECEDRCSRPGCGGPANCPCEDPRLTKEVHDGA